MLSYSKRAKGFYEARRGLLLFSLLLRSQSPKRSEQGKEHEEGNVFSALSMKCDADLRSLFSGDARMSGESRSKNHD